MFRRLFVLLPLLLLGCAPETYSQTANSSVTFKGLICIGCNATSRNTVVPSPDEMLLIVLYVLILAVIVYCWIAYLHWKRGG